MTPRLELRDICKSYPNVVANENVSLTVMPGEIHAVLGENGAGKSTLMQIIYGATRADSGEILCDGRTIETHNPGKSRALGIEMVYQHFTLFESASVAENIALVVDTPFRLDVISKRVVELSNKYGLAVDPKRKVVHLSVGERQRVEILRCLLQKPKLLILDEPTSVLPPQAVSSLFGVLRSLAAEGCSILYISHKLDEVRELCDTATVLRNGRVTGSARPKETTALRLSRMMVGAELPEMHVVPSVRSQSPILEVTNLSAAARDKHGAELSSISFDVHGGEIVGIAGISGNGQAELIALLSGETPHVDPGVVKIAGQPVGTMDSGARRTLGMAFVPEERLGRGAVAIHSLSENGMLTGHSLGSVQHGLINHRRAGTFAAHVISKYDVKAGALTDAALSLSGGNLQKFIVGREIELGPKLLLLSQPTWGVDVGAAAYIRQSIVDLSRSGTAILIVSEELDELFEICDRLLVICRGRMSRALVRRETGREDVGLLMAHLGAESALTEP